MSQRLTLPLRPLMVVQVGHVTASGWGSVAEMTQTLGLPAGRHYLYVKKDATQISERSHLFLFSPSVAPAGSSPGLSVSLILRSPQSSLASKPSFSLDRGRGSVSVAYRAVMAQCLTLDRCRVTVVLSKGVSSGAPAVTCLKQ